MVEGLERAGFDTAAHVAPPEPVKTVAAPLVTARTEASLRAGEDGDGDHEFDGTKWPDETAEAYYLSGGEHEEPSHPESSQPIERLPALDDLVSRVPEKTRALLDELFRARFERVIQARENELKRG